jgi:hypothetical protein
MRERETWEGRARIGRGRAAGARGPSWATPRVKNPVARTTTDRNSIRKAKSETRLSNTHD